MLVTTPDDYDALRNESYQNRKTPAGGRRNPALDDVRDLVDKWLEYTAVPGRSNA